MSDAKQPEEQFELSITEISYSFGINQEIIQEMIDQGMIQVSISHSKVLKCTDADLSKIRSALRLHQDLGINIAGAALVLELMDRIEELERML